MLKLYDYVRAPNARRARIFLAEKAMAFEKIEVDLAAVAQLQEPFKTINPRGTVPVLELEDGTRLADCAAIFAWAEAVQPEPSLLGRTPLEKAAIAGWAVRVEQDAFIAVAEAFRNSIPLYQDRGLPGPVNYAQIPELVTRGKQRTAAFYDVLDAHLEGRDWIAADDFSLADINALITLDFAKAIRVQPEERHANLNRWRAAASARPSALA